MKTQKAAIAKARAYAKKTGEDYVVMFSEWHHSYYLKKWSTIWSKVYAAPEDEQHEVYDAETENYRFTVCADGELAN